MRILDFSVKNFGSYQSLTFSIDRLGLSLLYGKTGSGKSTIPDIIAWIMYGVTAKDGSVDDVRSWDHDGEPTTGTMAIQTQAGFISIHRIRGSVKENDLYWTEGNSDEKKRGKDIAETQKLLDARLGVSFDLYVTASYFHEFSPAGTFFTAKAKARRELFETIADLDLPARLALKCQEGKKETKPLIDTAQKEKTSIEAKLEQAKEYLVDTKRKSTDWDAGKERRVLALKTQWENFKTEHATKIAALKTKADIADQVQQEQLDKIGAKLVPLNLDYEAEELEINAKIENYKAQSCQACGGPLKSKEIEKIYTALQSLHKRKATFDITMKELERCAETENPHLAEIARIQHEENPYLERFEAEQKCENPFISQIADLTAKIDVYTTKQTEVYFKIFNLEVHFGNLSMLYELSSELRGCLIEQTMTQVQDRTNAYLETYFDGEFRVELSTAEGGDSLEVTINKEGHQCNYKQLSKGQRSLLRLCFVISLMIAASNKAGVSFNCLALDEALDGLDSELKAKAFALLEEVSKDYDTVLVIDHEPGFQNLFDRRYKVELVDGHSEVSENE